MRAGAQRFRDFAGEGDIPSPANPPKGCKFHTRCRECMAVCKEQAPEAKDMGNGHVVRCHLYDK